MGNFLYVLAGVLLIFWIIGFYSTNAGSIIHILFVMAFIALIVGIVKDKTLFKKLRTKLK